MKKEIHTQKIEPIVIQPARDQQYDTHQMMKLITIFETTPPDEHYYQKHTAPARRRSWSASRSRQPVPFHKPRGLVRH